MGLGLGVAALIVLTNLMLTMSGNWDQVMASPALKLTLVGASGYAFISVLAAIQGFRSVGSVIGLTTWNDGITIGLMLVVLPLLGMGFVFHAFPRASGREIFDADAATRGMRLTVWAGGLTSVMMLVAGIVQGLSWNFGVSSASFANTGLGFQETLGRVTSMFMVAAVASLIALVGLSQLAWATIRTFTSGAAAPTEALVDVAATGEASDDE